MIDADNELFAMSCRPTDHKGCQLEHLKQQKLMRKTKQNNSWKLEQHVDWIRYILRTGAGKHGNQPVHNRTTRIPTSWRLLVDDRSSCRCSCTKDLYSALHASTSLPLLQPFSKSPSNSLLNSWKGATSSPKTTIAGQKQLNLVVLLISKQLSTEHNSQILRGSDRHHGENLSVGTGY